jgi:putative spermidine/putrescine transport system substrate-binding protein
MHAHRESLRRGWARLLLLAVVLAVPLSASAQSQLTVVSFGGSYQEAQRKAFFEPFAKAAGVKLVEDEWAGQMAKLRAMVQSGNVTWDVLSISDGQLPLACDEGLVEMSPSSAARRTSFRGGSIRAASARPSRPS